MRILLKPDRHLMVGINATHIENLRSKLRGGQHCFSLIRLKMWLGLEGICFPLLACRIRDVICITQVLHSKRIFWDHNCTLADFFISPIFPYNKVCPARVEIRIFFGFSNCINVQELCLIITPDFFLLACFCIVDDSFWGKPK